MKGPSGALLVLASLHRFSRGRNGPVFLPTLADHTLKKPNIPRHLTFLGKSDSLANTTGRGESCLV